MNSHDALPQGEEEISNPEERSSPAPSQSNRMYVISPSQLVIYSFEPNSSGADIDKSRNRVLRLRHQGFRPKLCWSTLVSRPSLLLCDSM